MAEGKNKYHFPKKFLWGASVSAHQVEGGNHNQWSVWELETAQVKAAQAPYTYGHLKNWKEIEKEATDPATYVSGRAADHFNRFEHDFALAKQLRLNAMRSGIEWSRIEPEEGRFDPKALGHYRTYFQKMRAAGLTPVVTLWHWTMPVWFAQKGGFEKRANIKYFVRYVEHLLKHMPEIFEGHVITINEPTIYTVESYLHKRWPPQKGSYFTTLQVLCNLISAHKKAYKLIKAAQPQSQIGLAHNCAALYAGDDSVVSRFAVWVGNRFGNEWLIARLKRHQDFLGLNYYFAQEFHGLKIHNPNKRLNDLGWDMQPQTLQPLLERLWRRFHLPIMVTESGTADQNDAFRRWWIAESIHSMGRAQRSGVVMKGYIHWSLLDNFEWAEGFWPRFGLIEINYKTQQRKPRESAKFYARFIQNQQD